MPKRSDEMADKVIEEEKKQQRFIMALAVTSIVTMMNNTTVSVSLPSFMEIFAIDVRAAQWVIVGYMLPLGMCMPLSGYLGARYGYRKVYLLMLIFMGIASLGCAVAQSFYILVAFRFLKGVFAGIIIPFTISMIYYYIPKYKQVKYLGISNMTNAFGVTIGPSMAGFILQYGSWHALFLFNIPLIVLAFWLSYRALPKSAGNKATKRTDILGIGQICFGTGLVLLAFTNLEIWGVNAAKFWLMIVIGLALVAVFIYRQGRIANPLLNFAVLKYRSFAVTVIVSAFMATVLGINGILNNIFMQSLLRLSPFQAGIAMLIPSIVLILGTEATEILIKRLSSKTLVVAGVVLVSMGNLLMSNCKMETSIVTVVIFLSVRYFGLGLEQTPLSDYGMKMIPQEMAGHASSMLSWCKQIATIVSTDVLTIAMSINTTRYYKTLGGGAMIDKNTTVYQEALLKAVNMDYFYLACMAMAAMIAAVIMMKSKEK